MSQLPGPLRVASRAKVLPALVAQGPHCTNIAPKMMKKCRLAKPSTHQLGKRAELVDIRKESLGGLPAYLPSLLVGV